MLLGVGGGGALLDVPCLGVAVVSASKLHTIGVLASSFGWGELICYIWSLVLPNKMPYEEMQNFEGLGPKRTISCRTGT